MEPAFVPHQKILKNVVCRFSLVSQRTSLTVQVRFNFKLKNPVCIIILIMYFCYQSDNAYICYVIVFDKQVTLYSRLFVCFFFVWWVIALSALWTDSRIRRWFSIIRLLFIHAFTFYRALLQLIEATNIARRSWTAGGRQSTKSERPSRISVLRFIDGKGHMDTSARLPGWKRHELAVRMASSCLFYIISMPEENPKCGERCDWYSY